MEVKKMIGRYLEMVVKMDLYKIDLYIYIYILGG